jgi:hypothetical protein
MFITMSRPKGRARPGGLLEGQVAPGTGEDDFIPVMPWLLENQGRVEENLCQGPWEKVRSRAVTALHCEENDASSEIRGHMELF